jgi:hypothetical protein
VLSKNACCELCWFGATCLGVCAYIVALFALDLTAGQAAFASRPLLLSLAGGALALMSVLIVVALRMDRRRFP